MNFQIQRIRPGAEPHQGHTWPPWLPVPAARGAGRRAAPNTHAPGPGCHAAPPLARLPDPWWRGPLERRPLLSQGAAGSRGESRHEAGAACGRRRRRPTFGSAGSLQAGFAPTILPSPKHLASHCMPHPPSSHPASQKNSEQGCSAAAAALTLRTRLRPSPHPSEPPTALWRSAPRAPPCWAGHKAQWALGRGFECVGTQMRPVHASQPPNPVGFRQIV